MEEIFCFLNLLSIFLQGHNFHWLTTFGWLFEGAVHGMVCFWLSMSALATTTWEPEGRIVSKLVVSTVVCTYAVV